MPHRSPPAATVAASSTHSSAGGDTQQPTHTGDRIIGLVIAHEPEPFDWIVFVSQANQTAAFERISRSSQSRTDLYRQWTR